MLPLGTPPSKPHRSPFYPPSATPPERTILRSPMGPRDGQSWTGRVRSSTSQEMSKQGRERAGGEQDENDTPTHSSSRDSSYSLLLATPSLSYTSSPYDSARSSAYSYSPQTPINHGNGLSFNERRRTFSMPFKQPSTPSPPSSPLASSTASSTHSVFDQLAYELFPSLYSSQIESAYDGESEERAWLLVNERELETAKRSRDESRAGTHHSFSSWEELHDDDDEESCGKTTLTSSTPALPHTPTTPPRTLQTLQPSTPPQKTHQITSRSWFTPPPPASRRIVPTLPPAPASAPRTRMPRALSPFKEHVLEGDEDVYAGPVTPERKGGQPARLAVQGESPPGNGSPPSRQHGWKPKLSGLSPSQRGARENGSAVAAGGMTGGGRIVTFGEKLEEQKPTRTTMNETRSKQPLPRTESQPKREKACGCCEEIVSMRGVKIGPCGCFCCSTCFTSGVNVVCDVAGGTTRCPACTTPVKTFATYSPAQSNTPSPPPRLPFGMSASQHRLKAYFSGSDVEAEIDSSQLHILRFDNASWDVTPEIIVKFLPANTLPEGAENPHPIHLLIDPISGKTKDYFFVEVKSKKAAALVIKSVQGKVLGSGKRARRVTITNSNLAELRQEIYPRTPRDLTGLIDLCQLAFSNKKSFLKHRSFPFLYLLSILTRSDLQGIEFDVLLAFQGATSVLSTILEAGVATAEDIALTSKVQSILSTSPLLMPVIQGSLLTTVLRPLPGPTPMPIPNKTSTQLFDRHLADAWDQLRAGLRV